MPSPYFSYLAFYSLFCIGLLCILCRILGLCLHISFLQHKLWNGHGIWSVCGFRDFLTWFKAGLQLDGWCPLIMGRWGKLWICKWHLRRDLSGNWFFSFSCLRSRDWNLKWATWVTSCSCKHSSRTSAWATVWATAFIKWTYFFPRNWVDVHAKLNLHELYMQASNCSRQISIPENPSYCIVFALSWRYWSEARGRRNDEMMTGA